MDNRRRCCGSIDDLTVKGVAYKTGHHWSPSTAKTTTLAAAEKNFTTGKKTLLSTSLLRKSDSLGDVKNISNQSYEREKSQVTQRFDGICKCKCKCRQDINVQRHDQYQRNLQQQIQLLEIENNFLRKNAKAATNSQNNSDTKKAMLVPQSSGHKAILKNVDRDHNEKYSDSNEGTVDRLEVKQHVAIGQAELLQKLEESYQRELRMEQRFKEKMKEIREIETENTVLIQKIQQIENEVSIGEEKSARDKRALMEEIVDLQRRLDGLTPLLANKESQIAKIELEKEEIMSKLRSSMGQVNSLQIKLNENKWEEVALSTLEIERREEMERLTRNVRRLESELDVQKEKERSLIDELNTLKRSLREEQLKARKDNAISEKTSDENSALIRENSEKCAHISRLEMIIEDLRREVDQRRAQEINSAEYTTLRDSEKSMRIDLSRLQEKLRSEQERYHFLEKQFEEFQRNEEMTRDARFRTQKELDALRTLSDSLSSENKLLRQEKATLAERCDELVKKGHTIRAESTSRQRNMQSLIDANREIEEKIENKDSEIATLKRDIRVQVDRNHELQRKVLEKEDDLLKTNSSFEALNKTHKQLVERFEHESAKQAQKSNEYERLASRVRELSESIPFSESKNYGESQAQTLRSQIFQRLSPMFESRSEQSALTGTRLQLHDVSEGENEN